MEAGMDDQNQEILMTWKTPAYAHYERGAWWYVILGLSAGGLLVTAFWTDNFLLAVLVIMAAVVLVIQGSVHPSVVDVEIGSAGIRVGENFFAYRSLDNFWIVYDPPLKSLHLTVPRSLLGMVHVPIDDQDPNQIREHLKKFVREDLTKDSEPILESISRILRI